MKHSNGGREKSEVLSSFWECLIIKSSFIRSASLRDDRVNLKRKEKKVKNLQEM